MNATHTHICRILEIKTATQIGCLRLDYPTLRFPLKRAFLTTLIDEVISLHLTVPVSIRFILSSLHRIVSDKGRVIIHVKQRLLQRLTGLMGTNEAHETIRTAMTKQKVSAQVWEWIADELPICALENLSDDVLGTTAVISLSISTARSAIVTAKFLSLFSSNAAACIQLTRNASFLPFCGNHFMQQSLLTSHFHDLRDATGSTIETISNATAELFSNLLTFNETAFFLWISSAFSQQANALVLEDVTYALIKLLHLRFIDNEQHDHSFYIRLVTPQSFNSDEHISYDDIKIERSCSLAEYHASSVRRDRPLVADELDDRRSVLLFRLILYAMDKSWNTNQRMYNTLLGTQHLRTRIRAIDLTNIIRQLERLQTRIVQSKTRMETFSTFSNACARWMSHLSTTNAIATKCIPSSIIETLMLQMVGHGNRSCNVVHVTCACINLLTLNVVTGKRHRVDLITALVSFLHSRRADLLSCTETTGLLPVILKLIGDKCLSEEEASDLIDDFAVMTRLCAQSEILNRGWDSITPIANYEHTTDRCALRAVMILYSRTIEQLAEFNQMHDLMKQLRVFIGTSVSTYLSNSAMANTLADEISAMAIYHAPKKNIFKANIQLISSLAQTCPDLLVHVAIMSDTIVLLSDLIEAFHSYDSFMKTNNDGKNSDNNDDGDNDNDNDNNTDDVLLGTMDIILGIFANLAVIFGAIQLADSMSETALKICIVQAIDNVDLHTVSSEALRIQMLDRVVPDEFIDAISCKLMTQPMNIGGNVNIDIGSVEKLMIQSGENPYTRMPLRATINQDLLAKITIFLNSTML